MAKKPSLGRQKIKIAKIQIKNHLQVTFSKRRSGLFKKASELCTLCGVEIAIVVFSPAGKVFSFGHPKVESVTDRFLARNTNLGPTSLHLVESHRIASIPELKPAANDSMEELKKSVVTQANKLLCETSDSILVFGANNNSFRGGFDRDHEMKLGPIMSTGASHGHNYGYIHGLL
ncbi:hypothetical protein R6Q59_014523 [Mikania micrantha]